MTADTLIRPESPDQPAVRALLSALDAYLASLYAPEHCRVLDVAALLSPDILFLVARQGGRAVGCGAARPMAGEPATGGMAYGEIKRMYVDPLCRGQRMAEPLLQQLEAELVARDRPLALLVTGRDQTGALRLYERGGYPQRDAFGSYPDNGLSVFHEKPLVARRHVEASRP